VTKELTHPDWVRRVNLFGTSVGGARSLVSLDPTEMLTLARRSTNLTDVGLGDWPLWEETYRQLLTSIDNESRLHTLGRLMTRAEALRVLQTWLRLQDHWSRNPAVLQEPISSPIFVVGPPRTGTSILLELLALDPQLRAPVAWEALHPLPRFSGEGVDDVARRREVAECEQEFWGDVHPEFMTMHELASDLPCECVHFLSYDFGGPYWSMLFNTPSFTTWRLEHLETLPDMYRLHRRMLQTFQHGNDTRRWLLKSPGHLSTLPYLFGEYPDARVIHTHRDPSKFVASLVSLLSVLRFMRSDDIGADQLGPMMMATYQMFLEQVIDQRESGVIPNDQIVDSHFLDLMADPVAQLRGIYERLDLDWPGGHDQAVRGYLDAKPKGKFGEHKYSFADVGLDPDAVREAFVRYRVHYGITEEPVLHS
jgi:hypothetical protein